MFAFMVEPRRSRGSSFRLSQQVPSEATSDSPLVYAKGGTRRVAVTIRIGNLQVN